MGTDFLKDKIKDSNGKGFVDRSPLNHKRVPIRFLIITYIYLIIHHPCEVKKKIIKMIIIPLRKKRKFM